VLDVALVVCGVIAAMMGLYGLYFVWMALPLTRRPAPRDVVPATTHRFAVLVFAKNEAAVIGQLVETLRAQRYPSDAFDVYVVADNSTDDTARIARDAGAIVWVRDEPGRTGKGLAVRWFFEEFRTRCASRYDACAMFDADNIVDPGFLDAMNRQLNQGFDISIGRRLSKNASSSGIAGATAMFWLLQARFFLFPRVLRGLPCPTVGGTGFAFLLDVLPDGHWPTKSTCEDIEFTLRAIADGFSVSFTRDAVFYDEQPLTWRQSVIQRYRWSLGILEMLTYGAPVLWRTFRQRWRTSYDALIYSIGGLAQGVGPLASVVMTILIAAKTGQWLAMGLGTVIGAVVAYVAVVVFGRVLLAVERQWWPGAWKAIAVFPVFLVTWSVIAVVVLFYRNPTWVPTPHTQALTLDDVRRGVETGRPRPKLDGPAV